MANITRQYWKSLEKAFAAREDGCISETIVNSSVDLVLMVNAVASDYLQSNAVQVSIDIDGDPDMIPLINTDRDRLAELLEIVLRDTCENQKGQYSLAIRLQRLARKIKIVIGKQRNGCSDSGQVGCPNIFINTKLISNGPAVLKELNESLGTRTKLIADEEARWFEITVPINAGVAMPEPSKSAFDVIRINKAANENCRGNPITRIHKTG